MIHLHVHTRFSVGDALASSYELAKSAGRGSVLAITDHDCMSGIVEHHKACRKFGVKPIYGMEATVEGKYHLTLLAKNQEGILNLFRLCRTNKTYGDLQRCSKGVIALSGDLMGAIPVAILNKDLPRLNKHLGRLTSIFGDDFYLEKIDHGLREQKIVNDTIDRLPVPAVWTNDVHYMKPEDVKTQILLMCDEHKRYADAEYLDYHAIDEAYLKELPDNPLAQEIADKCNASLQLGRPALPPFRDDEDDYLRKLAHRGFDERGCPGSYKDRLEYELDVIQDMGYSGYFLIVWDFIKYAHDQGIPVGPGRGSGAGSLVAYVLNITNVDPIKRGLIFERFLNPDRVSMPDFDIDFSRERRGEVIRYVVKKYGEDRVAQICTFGELKAKSAWQSAARVLGVSSKQADHFSKSLPKPPKDSESLSDIFKNGRLKESVPQKYDKIAHLITDEIVPVVGMACELEGAYRSVGKHAAGVLISDGAVYNSIPVWDTGSDFMPIDSNKNDDTRYMSQLQYTDAEKMGLVKFDFLGLKELDVIEYALRFLREEGIPVPDIHEIPLDDEKTFDLISSGKTIGMFQIASQGMARMCEDMKPSRFADIVALVALYRPGPMDAGMDRLYIRRKNGLEPVEYLHPDLEKILDDTYGVIVYQEQVMAIAQKICGYSLGEADILRRAMGKKKQKEMERQKEVFFNGGKELGYDYALLKELWRQIETFARYGFNRAHATAYGLITYQTAWLKAHYPAQLLAAQMQVRQDDLDEVTAYVREAWSLGLEVKEPDVQDSSAQFKTLGNTIYIGTSSLRSMDADLAQAIEDNAPYENLTSVFQVGSFNKQSMDAMLYSGALDSVLNGERHQARADFQAQYKKYWNESRDFSPDQESLFNLEIPFEEGVADPLDPRELLDLEKEYLGRYRTGHPVDEFRNRADSIGVEKIADLQEDCLICGLIVDIHEITTKNGDLMAFLRMEDETGAIDVTVFPDDYDAEYFESLVEKVVFCRLNVDYYEGKLSPNTKEVKRAYH